MKSFVIACAVAIIIAVGAGVILTMMQEPSAQTFKSRDVRL
jgi:hypothetical protein